ncbi:MAG: SMC-Scp complex subunit ScpB, partial [Nitrococcus sp.]|nr:SMC-Scp complex subunit ScpB [Nitrococcus sp.]
RVAGHRELPGRPALFGTTRAFLDYFNLKSLNEMPALAELGDWSDYDSQLDACLAEVEGRNTAQAAG